MNQVAASIHLRLINVSCASCVKSIEAALKALPGLEKFNVNFAQRTVTAQGNVTQEQVIKVIEDAGYQAVELNDSDSESPEFSHMKKLFFKAGISGLV